jgi:hypothetical protein
MAFGTRETCSSPIILIFAGSTRGLSSRRLRPQSRKNDGPVEKIPNRILMLGRLRELALYRAEVLRHHGFEVIAPADEAEAIAAIGQANYDVDLIRDSCPECQVLAIAQTMQYDRLIAPDSVVVADKGPAELVTALRRLLQSR